MKVAIEIALSVMKQSVVMSSKTFTLDMCALSNQCMGTNSLLDPLEPNLCSKNVYATKLTTVTKN